ncbi:Cell shape-determining protein MreC [Maioricimonas rarisocia]|uniref:Cell shape-determining protein MreC n=2 Tax=Maioricimonas rarisocia TaxID=2528026 RepID=A0A517Z2Q1_9PLAN|nr:Cell shape-determining protein MreC [Maioricimonas rarisocia]
MSVCWLLGGLLLASSSDSSGPIRNRARDLVAPGASMIQTAWSKSSRIIADLRYRPVDTSPVEQLEEELAHWRRAALAMQIREARLREDLERLQTDVNVTASESLTILSVVPARVLGGDRDRLIEWSTSLLNRGTHDGLAVGDFVLGDDGLLIDQGETSGVEADLLVRAGRQAVGRISSVGRWTSTVQPVTDPGFRGAAQLVRRLSEGTVFGAEGVLTGDGEGGCLLQFVSATAPVAVGDLVYSPVLRSPGGVPLHYGTVVRAELATGASHWVIEVDPAISLAEGLPGHVEVLTEHLRAERLAAVPSRPQP